MANRQSIRGPFQVKGSPFWYVEIHGKRRSLKTTDKLDAEIIVTEIRGKMDVAGPSVNQDLLGHTAIECTIIYGRITQAHAAKEIERISIDPIIL